MFTFISFWRVAAVVLCDMSSTVYYIGAIVESPALFPAFSGRRNLSLLGGLYGIAPARIEEVLGRVGLADRAGDRVKTYSLGMGQRLGLAGAILGRPKVLLLDEPANGLDPQSIQWLRDFLRHYAGQGNVVFVSSHLLSEMSLMAEHLVVIAAGRLVADESIDDFVARSTRNDVLVRCSDPAALAAALASEGVAAVPEGADGLAVATADTDRNRLRRRPPRRLSCARAFRTPAYRAAPDPAPRLMPRTRCG